MKGIGYNLGHKFDYLKDSQPFDMCFTIEETRYNGQVSLQIRLKDLEKVQAQATDNTSPSIPMTSENGLPTLED